MNRASCYGSPTPPVHLSRTAYVNKMLMLSHMKDVFEVQIADLEPVSKLWEFQMSVWEKLSGEYADADTSTVTVLVWFLLIWTKSCSDCSLIFFSTQNAPSGHLHY